MKMIRVIIRPETAEGVTKGLEKAGIVSLTKITGL